MIAYKKVLKARSKERPVASDYIQGLFSQFTELHGDRRAGDDTSVIGGIALLGDMPVTVIGIEKGKDTNEKDVYKRQDEDAFKLVLERAKAMSVCAEEHPGAMAAVLKLSADKVAELCLSLIHIYSAYGWSYCPWQSD